MRLFRRLWIPGLISKTSFFIETTLLNASILVLSYFKFLRNFLPELRIKITVGLVVRPSVRLSIPAFEAKTEIFDT